MTTTTATAHFRLRRSIEQEWLRPDGSGQRQSVTSLRTGLAEIIGHDLESHGVPSAAVVEIPALNRGNSTREEAEALAGLVASRGWKSVLVVTSDYHVRRARFIFEHVFPAAVTVHMSSARDSEFDASRWWETRTGIKIFAGELLGYVVAAWELRRNLDASEMLGVSAIPRILFRIVPIRSQLSGTPVSDWKHPLRMGGRTGTARVLYSASTVLSGLPYVPPQALVASEFRFWGNFVCGVNPEGTKSTSPNAAEVPTPARVETAGSGGSRSVTGLTAGCRAAIRRSHYILSKDKGRDSRRGRPVRRRRSARCNSS